jgi:hypothetical protein
MPFTAWQRCLPPHLATAKLRCKRLARRQNSSAPKMAELKLHCTNGLSTLNVGVILVVSGEEVRGRDVDQIKERMVGKADTTVGSCHLHFRGGDFSEGSVPGWRRSATTDDQGFFLVQPAHHIHVAYEGDLAQVNGWTIDNMLGAVEACFLVQESDGRAWWCVRSRCDKLQGCWPESRAMVGPGRC